MDILLTGATGFLGSHLLPKLVERGHNVIILKRSFSNTWRIKDIISKLKNYDIDKIDLEKVFQENKINVIIHLATDYGRKNMNDVLQMLKPDIELPTKLLDLGTKYGSSFFVNAHTSTDSQYTLYSAMKNAFIEIAKFFIANCKINFVNITIEYMYGEKDDATKFIPYVIESMLDKKEIKATKGEQKRDFVYVEDVVNAYLRVLDNLESLDEKFIEFDIGTGKSISLKNCVSKIEKTIGEKANIEWGVIPYRKNDIFDSKANIDRAKELLNWQPEISLEEGLNNTIDWYKKCRVHRNE